MQLIKQTRRKRAGKKNKKTLVLTLGSLPEKGEKKKKNLGINLGQPVGKGRKKIIKKPWY
jgi:hypothetical protein